MVSIENLRMNTIIVNCRMFKMSLSSWQTRIKGTQVVRSFQSFESSPAVKYQYVPNVKLALLSTT